MLSPVKGKWSCWLIMIMLICSQGFSNNFFCGQSCYLSSGFMLIRSRVQNKAILGHLTHLGLSEMSQTVTGTWDSVSCDLV